MKNKKGNAGVVFLIVLLFITVIALSVYILIGNVKVDKDPENEQGKESEIIEKSVLYEDTSKAIVYSYKQNTENSEENVSRIVNLPYVNIASNYAREINQEISNYKLGYYCGYKYYTYLNDNILSVVFEETAQANSIRHYSVYNIDIYTGNKISNKEILEYIGTTEEKVKAVLPQSYHNAFLKKFSNISEIYDDYTKSEEYKNTVADTNCSLEVSMFLGDNKSLKFIGKVYSPAGPSFFWEIIDVAL